jgi:hypothetical protein
MSQQKIRHGLPLSGVDAVNEGLKAGYRAGKKEIETFHWMEEVQ